MEFIRFYRDYNAEDRQFVRRAMFQNTPCDWGMSEADPEGWRVLHARSWSGDTDQFGRPMPRYIPAGMNGEGKKSLLGYGKVCESFRIVAEDGRTWVVDAFAHDWWGNAMIRTRFLGRFDYRATA